MEKINKRGKEIIECILLFVIFFIAIRKGGYYKEDSLVGIYFIQLISAVYYIFCLGKIKINKVISTLLLVFIFTYCIPLIIGNSSTVSGALNFATRIYSLFLLYLIISNSQNKEKYIKAIVVFTIICGIFALDEMSFRIFNNTLNLIGGGYVEDNGGRIASIFQYSNLLGILCVISSIYLYSNILECDSDNKYKQLIKKVSLVFLTIILLLTQSKMALLLDIVFLAILCIRDKNKIQLLNIIILFLYAIIFTAFIEKISVLIILPALLIATVYLLFTNKKYRVYINIAVILLLIISIIILNKYVLGSGIGESIRDYFTNYNSSKLRFTYYKDALRLIFKTPINFIFGMGGNSFRTMYETVQEVPYISLEVHSFFIQIFLEAGILGLVTVIAILLYTLIKTKKISYKAMLIAVIIFSSFDVFFTYTFMMIVFVVLIALCTENNYELGKRDKILTIVLYTIFFIITTIHVIAFFITPIVVNNLNVEIEEQEDKIKKCELALKFDPYDIDYMRKYTLACETYLDILDIKKQLYGNDETNKRNDIINKIYNNVHNEIKYEESNKYAIEDSVYYVYKYLDELVLINYNGNEQEGYEKYLEEMLYNTNELKIKHNKNDYAMSIYKELINNLFSKYTYVNNLVNSNKIEDILNTMKENEYIAL